MKGEAPMVTVNLDAPLDLERLERKALQDRLVGYARVVGCLGFGSALLFSIVLSAVAAVYSGVPDDCWFLGFVVTAVPLWIADHAWLRPRRDEQVRRARAWMSAAVPGLVLDDYPATDRRENGLLLLSACWFFGSIVVVSAVVSVTGAWAAVTSLFQTFVRAMSLLSVAVAFPVTWLIADAAVGRRLAAGDSNLARLVIGNEWLFSGVALPQAHRVVGDSGAARIAYERLLGRNRIPWSVGIEGLAWVASQEERHRDAKQLFRCAVEIDPGLWRAYDGLAGVLEVSPVADGEEIRELRSVAARLRERTLLG